MKKDITSKKDAVTKDMVPETDVEETFNFPTLGVSVQAKSMSEALTKAKQMIKSKDNQ